jgi:hypothetical protein
MRIENRDRRVSQMDELESPETEELEHLAERLLVDYSSPSNALGDDIIMAIGSIYECISLRNGIEHAVATCTDPKTVNYLKQLMENANQYYLMIGDTESEQ